MHFRDAETYSLLDFVLLVLLLMLLLLLLLLLQCCNRAPQLRSWTDQAPKRNNNSPEG